MSQKTRAKDYWVHKVKTVSTFPPAGIFKDARTIAKALASKEVRPKGVGSGIRMIQYFINRGGKGLSLTRRRELERAKRILQDKVKSSKSRKHEKPRRFD
jgi:tRNA(adenine34) deaminase